LLFELLFELSRLLHLFLPLGELLFEEKLLALLLHDPCVIHRLVALREVIEESCLLLPRHLLVFVAGLELILSFLDSSPQVGGVLLDLGLLFTLVFLHLLVAREAIAQVFLEVVLHCFLLELDVPKATLLFLPLLSLVLFERRFVSGDFAVNEILIADKLLE